MPDSPVFLGLAADVISRARGGGRYEKCDGGVRWSISCGSAGDVAASMILRTYFINCSKA